MDEYANKFVHLSEFASYMITYEADRLQCFQQELKLNSQKYMVTS